MVLETSGRCNRDFCGNAVCDGGERNSEYCDPAASADFYCDVRHMVRAWPGPMSAGV